MSYKKINYLTLSMDDSGYTSDAGNNSLCRDKSSSIKCIPQSDCNQNPDGVQSYIIKKLSQSSDSVLHSEVPSSLSMCINDSDLQDAQAKNYKSCFNTQSGIVTPVFRKGFLKCIIEDAPFIIPYLMSHLSPKDVFRLSHVNHKLWTYVNESPDLAKIKHSYIEASRIRLKKFGKENISSKHPKEETAFDPFRKKLQDIQNVANHSQATSCQVVTYESVYDRLVKESKKIAVGERQYLCPKCRSPAHKKGNVHALCSDASCHYDYCLKCYLPFHTDDVHCKLIKSPVKHPPSNICSEKSRKRLRRL